MSRLDVLLWRCSAILIFFFTEPERQNTINAQLQPMSPSVIKPIHPGASIGHVHLKVADLERALRFYCGVLGFELTQRFGSAAAFISAGGYHHHIGLNTWESLGGSAPAPGTTGLYHLAILYPTRAELANALIRLGRAGIALDGASDHGVSEALYLRDPDENGVELYWDRPREQWPRTSEGSLAMFTRPLDLEDLLSEANSKTVRG
jgi:catechol 2,3-dioxygenase